MGTSLVYMTYIIAEPCIGCGAWEPECPVTAIFPDTEIRDDQTSYLEKNRSHFV